MSIPIERNTLKPMGSSDLVTLPRKREGVGVFEKVNNVMKFFLNLKTSRESRRGS